MGICWTNGMEKMIRESTLNLRQLALNPETTVVVNVDTINGFFKEGKLSSPRLTEIIPKVVAVNEYFLSSRKLFFVDTHTKKSLELKVYPDHCISEREQSIISELELFTEDATIIPKDSTNGFLAPEYVRWLAKNADSVDHYVVVGGVTDLCVMQYALTQKAYCNQQGIRAHVIIIENAVQTFHSQIHDGNLMHTFALANMISNGIKIATI